MKLQLYSEVVVSIKMHREKEVSQKITEGRRIAQRVSGTEMGRSSSQLVKDDDENETKP